MTKRGGTTCELIKEGFRLFLRRSGTKAVAPGNQSELLKHLTKKYLEGSLLRRGEELNRKSAPALIQKNKHTVGPGAAAAPVIKIKALPEEAGR